MKSVTSGCSGMRLPPCATGALLLFHPGFNPDLHSPREAPQVEQNEPQTFPCKGALVHTTTYWSFHDEPGAMQTCACHGLLIHIGACHKFISLSTFVKEVRHAVPCCVF